MAAKVFDRLRIARRAAVPLALAAIAYLLGGSPASAADVLYFSTAGGHNAWNSKYWGTKAGGGYTVTTWSTWSTAYFEGTGGAVTLNNTTPSVDQIYFTANNYVINTGTIHLGSPGTGPGIFVKSGTTATINAVFNTTNVAGDSITIGKSGYGGILILGGANTFTNALDITAGTLQVANNAALGNPGSSVVTIDGGYLDVPTGYTDTIKEIIPSGGNVKGGGTLQITGATAIRANASGTVGCNIAVCSGAAGNYQDIGADDSFTLTISGVVSSSGGATPGYGVDIYASGGTNGLGINIFSNAGNTYYGQTNIQNGTFRISSDGCLGNSTSINMSANTVLMNNNGAGSVSSSRTITLLGNAAIQAGWTSDFTINSRVTGSYGLTINIDGGRVVLANPANDYTGNTTIGGTLGHPSALNATLALGADDVIPHGAGKGNLVLTPTANGGKSKFDLNGHNVTINGLSNTIPSGGSGAQSIIDNSIAGTNALTVGDNNQTTTFSGVIQSTTGTIALTKIGTGTLTLSGSNTYIGTTTVNGGVLQIGAGSTTGSISDSSWITNNAAVAFNRSDTYTYNGQISGSGSVTQSGSGTLNLSAANSFSGETVFQAGVLNAATITPYGVAGSLGNRDISQDVAATVGLHFRGGALQYTGVGPQSTDRQMRVLQGISAVIDASGQGLASTVSFTNDAAPVNFWDGPSAGRSVTLTGANGGQNLFALNIPDYGTQPTSLIKDGAGTWVVTNPHNSDPTTTTQGQYGGYTGGTTIRNGTLVFAASALGTGPIDFTNISGAPTLKWYPGNTQDVSSQIKIEDYVTATVDVGGNSVTFGTTLQTGTAQTGALTKSGAGTLFLAAPNVFNGYTTVNQGALQLNDANALANSTVIDTVAGLRFNSGVGGFAIGGISGDITMSLTLADTGGTPIALTVGGNNQPAAYAGALTGNGGSLLKIGSGTQILSGANTYGGGTTLTAGKLSISSDNNIGGPAAAITFNGGVLQITGLGVTNIDSHTVNWSSFNGGFDIATASNSFSVGQSIGGAGGLYKTGPGTLTLTASNNYTGATTVNAGVLSLSSTDNIAGSSGLTMSGGTLRITGTVSFATAQPITGSGTAAYGLDVPNSGGVTLSGQINNGTLVKTGTGLLTLSGDSDNVALGLNVSAGTVVLAKDSVPPPNNVHAVGGGRTGHQRRPGAACRNGR